MIAFFAVAYDLANLESSRTPPERRHSISVMETPPAAKPAPKVGIVMYIQFVPHSPPHVLTAAPINSCLLRLSVALDLAATVAADMFSRSERRHSITVCESPTPDGLEPADHHSPLGPLHHPTPPSSASTHAHAHKAARGAPGVLPLPAGATNAVSMGDGL